MFRKKPKSILELSWLEVFKKIENNQILCTPYPDCLDILIDKNGLLSVLTPARVTDAVSLILKDISSCIKDLDSDVLPINLRLLGPQCSQYINVGKFYIVTDSIEKKVVHALSKKVTGAKIISQDAMSIDNIKKMCSFIKQELELAGVNNFKEKIKVWVQKRIESDSVIGQISQSQIDKDMFQEAVFDLFDSGKHPLCSSSKHRNDMQKRRQLSRLTKDMNAHLKRLLMPVLDGIKKFLMQPNVSYRPEYIYDIYAEKSARKARTRHLVQVGTRINPSLTKKIAKDNFFNIESKESIDTFLTGLLFIFKDSGLTIRVTSPLLDMWTSLEEIISKDKGK
jgi:hypothetical protein